MRNNSLKGFGPHPQYGWTFQKNFRKNSGETPETLSERFLKFLSKVRLGYPKPYNSRHLMIPEHFQNSLPPSTAGDASFFFFCSGEGLSELVMEFPAVLGAAFLRVLLHKEKGSSLKAAHEKGSRKMVRILPENRRYSRVEPSNSNQIAQRRCLKLGVSQQPLTLILLQKYRDTNGRRIVIQIGGVYTTFCQEEGILLQKYRDRKWEVYRDTFQKYQGQGSM